MNTIENLNELTVEITEFLEKLAEVQQKKLDAVRDSDLVVLDECMKQEQAAVMKSKSLDRKREAILADLGFSGLCHSQILEKISEEKKAVAEPLFEKLRVATNNFNELNNQVKTSIEVNLHSISNTIDNLKNSNGKNKNRGKVSFTDRMV